MTEKQPIQPALFELEVPTVAPVTPEITPAPGQRSVDYEPTSTQRYMEEMGGGSRESLAVDPPKIPRMTTSRTRRGNRESRYTDIGTDTLDSHPAYMSQEELAKLTPLDPNVNAVGRKAVMAALAPSKARRIAEDSANDPRTALALSRARTERSKE